MHADPRPRSTVPAPPHAGNRMLLAVALLGFGVAIFADHIASYYLLQWAPTLRRYPTHEERMAVMQALTLDQAIHVVMWAALAASLWTWRRASRWGEAAPARGRALAWLVVGVASYAVLRVVVQAQLSVHLVRVPNVELDIGWHGTGFGLAGVGLLAITLLVVALDRVPAPARVPD